MSVLQSEGLALLEGLATSEGFKITLKMLTRKEKAAIGSGFDELLRTEQLGPEAHGRLKLLYLLN